MEASSTCRWPRVRTVRCGSTIERDGKRIERQVVPAPVDRYDTGAIGVLPVTHPQISVVNEGQPADEADCRGAISSSPRPARRTSPGLQMIFGSHSANRSQTSFSPKWPQARVGPLDRSDSGARRAPPCARGAARRLRVSRSPSSRAISTGGCASARRSPFSSSRPSNQVRSTPSNSASSRTGNGPP